MRKLKTLVAAAGLASLAAQGAVVNYTLSGTSDNGTVVSGTFSFNTTTIGANYTSTLALDDLISFSVSLTSIPAVDGAPATTFQKGINTSSIFEINTDGSGAITHFSPGFDDNADGYSLNPFQPNQGTLEHISDGLSDTITWSYAQVPEVSTYAMAVGLGLAGFAGARSWRNRR